MKVAVFSTKSYDRQFLTAGNEGHGHDFRFFEPRLAAETATLAAGFPAVCTFVNDRLDAAVLESLHAGGTRLLALRCAGFNQVDLPVAARLEMRIARVPAYSPEAVAEHTVALILALNRKTHKAYNRVREGNFALDGLLGFDLCRRTVGVVGTGKIGAAVTRIMQGFGCQVLAHDPYPNKDCVARGVEFVPLEQLLKDSDIVTLHCPLTKENYHLINAETLAQMKRGVMLINTGRGPLVDAQAAIQALKSGQLGYLGLDVYEEERELFFEDLSGRVLQDDVFSRLLTFPNVLISGHQAFFTREALEAIAATTLENISAFEQGRELVNEVRG